MKNGDKIRVLQMEDHNGMDTQAIRMNGRTYTVDYLDDAGQIHLQESGLAVIPDVDRYVVIERGKEYDSIQEYDRGDFGDLRCHHGLHPHQRICRRGGWSFSR